MRDAENIRALDEKRLIDWMGFIFYPQSPRYVHEKPTYLPKNCRRVGVFVNENILEILKKIDDYQLDGIQLHGNESPEFCSELKNARPGIFLIKAFSINKSAKNLFENTNAYENHCDYFLFDTATKGYGGSGKQFDWNILQAYHGSTPFLFSGGIKPESIKACSNFRHVKCVGIDLNSGFEIAPAFKDVEQISQFIQQLNS